MKIIKEGDRKKSLKWYLKTEITCAMCGCVFMLEKGDEFDVEYDQRQGAYIRVPCPTCEGTVFYDKKE